MPGSFIDTNVLVYLASGDRTKADRAETLIGSGEAMISIQVLNELANVARRKMRLSWTETRAFFSMIRALLPPVHPSPSTSTKPDWTWPSAKVSRSSMR
jgi:predicted nucleic acid-binding protein